jgi:hypothetical protein
MMKYTLEQRISLHGIYVQKKASELCNRRFRRGCPAAHVSPSLKFFQLPLPQIKTTVGKSAYVYDRIK